MCGGGGGGEAGASNEIARENQRIEQERRDRIAGNVNKIGAFFSDPSRDRSFEQARTDTIGRFLPQLNDQRDDANKLSKFELARRGQIGGSAQIDTAAEIDDRFNKGINQVSLLGAQAENAARAADARTQSDLVLRAQSGEEIGSLINNANNSVASSLAAGSNAVANAQLGDQFENAGNLFGQISATAGNAAGKNNLQALLAKTGPLFSTKGNNATEITI